MDKVDRIKEQWAMYAERCKSKEETKKKCQIFKKKKQKPPKLKKKKTEKILHPRIEYSKKVGQLQQV